MHRRDALKALIALPAVTRIARADLQPDDVIVVECDTYLSVAVIERVRTQLATIWPGRTILVCDGGIRLKIVPASLGPASSVRF